MPRRNKNGTERFYDPRKAAGGGLLQQSCRRDRRQEVDDGDVFIVWFSKTLQNWKALVSTTVSDGMYYEITHNGDKKETYLDVYKKWENQCIADGNTAH